VLVNATSTGATRSTAPDTGDLARLRAGGLGYDEVIDEVHGRYLRIGDQWLVDYASCNYLGFDLEPQIIDAVTEQVRRWGTHPGWSRLLGSPRLYPEIEQRLAALLGAPDTLLLPTITHIHMSVLPVLARGGEILLDGRAHKTIYDGCRYAQGLGANLRRFGSGDADELARLLRATAPGRPRLVCMDGVNSMSGDIPDLRTFARLCREHDALLYVDDAHGFGILGERAAGESSPYGSRGNSVVRHLGEEYENLVLVGGFSKAYSALLAFVALPTAVKEELKTAAPPYLYSGPSPVASLAGVLAGFEVNEERGDALRAHLYRLTARVLGHLRALGVATLNRHGTPIVEVPVATAEALAPAARLLRRRGIYPTLAAYPLVPRADVGFRVQMTAAHDDAQVDQLAGALTELAERDLLRPA
jgi:8-amino-7-oxononanoate synthase